MISRTGLVEENDARKVPEMRDHAYGRRLGDSVELEVFGGVEEDFATSDTITDSLDCEVPDDREEEDPTGKLMVTMEVSSWVISFPCKVCGEVRNRGSRTGYLMDVEGSCTKF